MLEFFVVFHQLAIVVKPPLISLIFPNLFIAFPEHYYHGRVFTCGAMKGKTTPLKGVSSHRRVPETVFTLTAAYVLLSRLLASVGTGPVPVPRLLVTLSSPTTECVVSRTLLARPRQVCLSVCLSASLPQLLSLPILESSFTLPSLIYTHKTLPTCLFI